MIFGDSLNVFAFQDPAVLAILQSRVHEIWARFFGSSLEDRLRYTPTDCFETFPFPAGWNTNLALQQIGQRYQEYRAGLMKRTGKGLTETYNRFHNKCNTDAEISILQQLHTDMDRTVLRAYGWDLEPTLDFILDHEDDEEGIDDGKKPWRYRWVDEDRDEILARLLELNRTRAEEQAQSAPAVRAPKKRGKSTTAALISPPKLFDFQENTE